MKSEEFKTRFQSISEETHLIKEHSDLLIEESERVVYITRHSDEFITDIERQFEDQTDIKNVKDMSLLFLATGLLCSKWIIMHYVHPLNLDFDHKLKPKGKRLDSTEMGYIDTDGKTIEKYKKTLSTVKKNREKLLQRLESCTDEEERAKILKKIRENEKRQDNLNEILAFFKRNPQIKAEIEKLEKKRLKLLQEDEFTHSKYRTITEILTRPVPYDAMQPVSERVNLPIKLLGTNHHAYTLGHDPIIGWVVGTMNIMSRSITLNDPWLPTFWVTDEGNKIKRPTGMGFISTIVSCINSTKEDDKRVPAAVIRHGLHMISDKYGKTGLPINIPFMSADNAQALIESGWNSEEAKKYLSKIMKRLAENSAIIGIQFFLSFFINQVIKAIHLMLYDENKDGDPQMYSVRTRKILMTANSIASTSNFAYVAISQQLDALDIGGAIETVHRIVCDTDYIYKIKEEFIRNSFHDLVMGDEEQLYCED